MTEKPLPTANGRISLPNWAAGLLGIFVVLLLGEVLTRTNTIPNRYFPSPSTTFEVLFEQLKTRALWDAIWNTMQAWALGLGIATVTAIPIGILIGAIPLLYRSVKVIIEFLRPIPAVALIPLGILIFGAGLELKIFLAAFASFWPLLFQTLYGIQDVDPIVRDTARAYGLNPLQYSLYIVLPSAAPYIATGLRVSSSIAIILAITGELVVGVPGLGREINTARMGGDAPLTYALISVAGMLGFLLNEVFRRLESILLHWHISQRKEQQL